MSEEILVFLAVVLLLKELGIIQAIKRFFNEGNEEKSSDEDKDETDEEDAGSKDKDETNEDIIGLDVDSNVEEASEESFEEIECSDKEPAKKVKPSGTLNNSSNEPEKEEQKKRTTFFDYIHADPEIIPRAFMKKKYVIPQPDPNKKKDDHVIMFDFKPIGRKGLNQPLEFMRDEEPIIKAKRCIVKNEYPRVTFIDKNTAKLEESPNDVFYCTTQDMPKIRMMPEKEQIKQLRMRKTHMDLLQMNDDDLIIDSFLL